MGERIRRKSLVNQLQDALTDAEVLQHQKNRGEESYISQCKLVSNRISALQKLISRKENAALTELKDQNEKLKRDNEALKLEIETLRLSAEGKAQPAEPAAPTPDAIAIKQSQDEIATTLERMRRGEGSGLSTDAAMAKQGEPQIVPAPTRLPDVSGIPEHMLPVDSAPRGT